MGCSGLAGIYEKIEMETVEEAVACALNLGLHTFDVAPHYGAGLAEIRLGKALRSYFDSKNCASDLYIWSVLVLIMV